VPSCTRRSPANPFIAFSTVATESGTIAFHWTGDNGFSVAESVAITVG
jgi:sulfur-oxidizing protein SoxZ